MRAIAAAALGLVAMGCQREPRRSDSASGPAAIEAAAAARAGSNGGRCDERAREECSRMARDSAIELPLLFGDATRCEARMKLACLRQLSPAAARPAGQPCGSDSQCESRLCGYSRGESCGRCREKPAVGAACEGLACGPGLECGIDGRCAQPGAEGAACDALSPCGARLSCVGAGGEKRGSCVREPAALGAACDPQLASGPDCDRRAGLFCEPASRQCARLRLSEPSEPCGLVGGALVLCRAGGSCGVQAGTLEGTCVPPAPDGAPCDVDHGPVCLPPARCVLRPGDSSRGSCQLPDPKC